MNVSVLLMIILFSVQFNHSALAASQPSGAQRTSEPAHISIVNLPQLQRGSVNVHSADIRIKRRAGLKQRLVAGLLKYKLVKQLIGIDEPTAKQRKLGRLSLIFAVAAIALIVIPYATMFIPAIFALASFPLGIAGLVLGIKSIKGNTNTEGLIGLILSAALLLVLILSVLFLAVFFSSWN